MERILIVVPGRPIPQARPRVNTMAVKRGRGLFTFLPKRTRDYQKLIASKCPRSLDPTCLRTVSVMLYLMAPIKVSVHSLRPDLDNFVKSALDGLQMGGVIADDSYIRELHVYTSYVRFKEREKLVMQLTPWGGFIPKRK